MDIGSIIKTLLAGKAGSGDAASTLRAFGVDPKQMQGAVEIENAVLSLAGVASAQGVAVYSVSGALKGRAFDALVVIREQPKN